MLVDSRSCVGLQPRTVCNEMLFENVLNLFPCGASCGLCKLAYSFYGPSADRDIKPAALFRSQLRSVFPDTFGYSHGGSLHQDSLVTGHRTVREERRWFMRPSPGSILKLYGALGGVPLFDESRWGHHARSTTVFVASPNSYVAVGRC